MGSVATGCAADPTAPRAAVAPAIDSGHDRMASVIETVVGAVVIVGLVLLVIVDAEARNRGRTDPRWRRVRSVLHSALTCLVVGFFGLIALVLLVFWIFLPIGGP